MRKYYYKDASIALNMTHSNTCLTIRIFRCSTRIVLRTQLLLLVGCYTYKKKNIFLNTSEFGNI